MDFCGLPRSRPGHETVWVVVDKLTKDAHFLPMNMTDPIDKLIVSQGSGSTTWCVAFYHF